QRGHPAGAQRQDRRGADGTMDAQERRRHRLLDAEGHRLAVVRDEPSRAPPRAVERVPAHAGRAAPRDVRPERRRAGILSQALRTGVLAVAFVLVATANGAGYRYGVSDQAFYIP